MFLSITETIHARLSIAVVLTEVLVCRTGPDRSASAPFPMAAHVSNSDIAMDHIYIYRSMDIAVVRARRAFPPLAAHVI